MPENPISEHFQNKFFTMQKLTKLADGLWHIEKFVNDDIWQGIKTKILNLSDLSYTNRHEPLRLRLEILDPVDSCYTELVELSTNTVPLISEITGINTLRNPPGLFLWRDFKNYKSDWHPDDFTTMPTAQIYLDGDESQGTSFRVNDKEIFIPFRPNTGYLMDNRYQIVHGMLVPVREKVRQSIYLIY